ncbi:type II toxin-antitoxin system RelE family toxin [Terriglobus saanensis]|uniref:Uncharacterized protein n=1 Tax=Terriglobus saanensis (strain ATCC BAA-1853 / DSM 23119 / SP1PR4) TaxID=401053 RepID=E8V2U4_TERSS|nr:hypothetical protein [Terriglobus saanensis]ADV84641.1 hypothetical protein AciPR4_3892 [Terriglobus saanensis SP1PR4]
MANTLYIAPSLVESVEKLSPSQKEVVLATLQSLSEDVDGNSSPLSFSSTDQFRVSHAGNVRIILQYLPEQERILVTSIDPDAYAAQAEAEELAASA